MTKKWTSSFVLIALISTLGFSQNINSNKKKAEEIKQLMWQSGNKDFAVKEVPEKWKKQSAVIISKSTLLTYKKALIGSSLSHDTYSHYRIKLQDNSAIEKYAQFSLPSDGIYGSSRSEFYAGFKIIKPNGKEIEISVSEAVLQKAELNNRGYNEYKLAIPNLEVGDILDYYICEDESISLAAKYHSFDPVIFQLHGDYPIMKQKISFEVLRRCFINLKSLNGAPEFEPTEGSDSEENFYSLEDSDRESIKDIRWLFPYRELPTIKFKITYASSLAAAMVPGFIGEPGVIKSDVSTEEIRSLFAFIFDYNASGSILKNYMNKNYKGVNDNNKLAREAYYALRNMDRFKYAENRLLSGAEANPEYGLTNCIASLSSYYKSRKISHEIIIGIPRQISELDNLIFENELTLMLKVNTSKPFFIGRFDNNSMVDEIDPDLQGQTVYSTSGLIAPASWSLKRTNIPVVAHDQNSINDLYKLKITDLTEGVIDLDASRSMKGASRIYYQNLLMDMYDYQDDEKKRMEKKATTSKVDKNLIKLREDYNSNRETNRNKSLKAIFEENFDGLTVESANDFKMVQAGRFDDQPEFKYNCKATLKGGLKRVGQNYLLDIGKFIEGQISITNEERVRNYNVYMSYANSYSNTIELELPPGYTVQGIDKLTSTIENETGGFKSQARVENNKLIIETFKFYKSNYQKKEDWEKMTAFLDAAYEFNQKQVLLEKNK